LSNAIYVLGSEAMDEKVLQSHKSEKRILQFMQVRAGSHTAGEYSTRCWRHCAWSSNT